MIKDVAPQQRTVVLAGKKYDVFPATIHMQNIIVFYFQKLENREIAGFAEAWDLIFPGDKESRTVNQSAFSHLVYLMIDFKEEEVLFEDFLNLARHKDTAPDLYETILKAWDDATPKHAIKKKKMKRILAILTIISAMTFWLLVIVYLGKNFLT